MEALITMQRYSKITTNIIFIFLLALGSVANAEETLKTHGISAYGDLKYPANYKHFEYLI
jgi:ABC-type oligopeptide transport system substrate-binding subunit